MRLKRVTRARSLRQRLELVLLDLRGHSPRDFNGASMQTSDYFSDAFATLQFELARGESDWTLAERELFAAFVSRINGCRF